jgi:Uma2 family endonuclease
MTAAELAEILPAQGSWTEEGYLRLTEHTNHLVEFTDGLLELLPMPTDKHQSIVEFLFLIFHQFITPLGGKVHIAPVRLQIRHGKFREPDILLLCSATDARRQNRFWLGADLALEVVSEDEPDRDLVEKRGDYAEARIPEYWIVNPQSQTITVLRLVGAAYQEAAVYGRGESAASGLVSGLSVSVSAVFDAD